MLSDHQIIDMVADGKVEHFGELIARYQKPVYRLAYSMLGNRADAEDAAQDVFIRAYKSISTYTDSGRFWGWLRKITVNVCLKKVRPVMLSIDDIDETPGYALDTVNESVINTLELDQLKIFIFDLPPAYRSVIVLKYLEDMSYSEIAEILGETVSNIQVRIFRAKKMLRERMQVNVQ